MSELNISPVTYTNMKGTVKDFSVNPSNIDSAGNQAETYWDNVNWNKNLGYYKTIPEVHQVIRTLVAWSVGKGYEADPEDEATIENWTGWGEDSFQSIMENMLTTMFINGDAYAEIIRNNETGQIINLKPLDPSVMRIVVGNNGIIKRYEQRNVTGKSQTFKPFEIFHITNERIASEIHGNGIVDACQWIIDARNEAMSDKRRVHHTSTIRVMEVDSDDPDKLATLKVQYADAIKRGEVLLVPKGNVTFPDAPINYIDTLEWIRYLESFFYVVSGVPKSIVNVEGFGEASSKIGYLTFEVAYTRIQTLLESDLRNQLAIFLKFNRPVSIGNQLQASEEANTGQTNIQPNDIRAGLGRTE